MQNNINTNKVTNDFNRTFYKKLTSNINYNDDYKINEVYESPTKTKTKKYNENKNKKDIKKIDTEKNDIDKKDEKIKKFRKNKAISVDKIKNDNKIFNFKSQKIKEKNKKKIIVMIHKKIALVKKVVVVIIVVVVQKLKKVILPQMKKQLFVLIKDI